MEKRCPHDDGNLLKIRREDTSHKDPGECAYCVIAERDALRAQIKNLTDEKHDTLRNYEEELAKLRAELAANNTNRTLANQLSASAEGERVAQSEALSLSQQLTAANKRVAELDWQPINTAPKDIPILGICVHDADPYYLEGEPLRLTTYGAHCEGLSHVPDGPHVLEWGGEYSESDWESGVSFTLPAWWFRVGSDFEEVANPTHWRPITPPTA